MGHEKAYYITTPIYYVNDVPHIGNAYTTIISDVIARYRRIKGDDVYFLTGTDENAIKVASAATSAGMEPQQFVDKLADDFRSVWKDLDIQYDDFIRTTEPRHKRVVEHVFSKLYEQGDIYKGHYEGWYCVPCETFFTEEDLIDKKCPNCGREVEWVEEENYYFKLSSYSDKLLAYIEEHPGFLQPEFRKNEVMSFIKDGLRDVSITRSNRGWGIPVPGDESKVIYVWFDALLNYISAIGYLEDDDKFNKYWPADIQLMGKDIFVRFHCTFWPAMLMALGLELPKVLFGHGFWTINGEKISKSLGNAISPSKLASDLSVESGAAPEVALDAVRYFLCREITFGLDGDFSFDSFRNRFNSDLANDLGNLLNRTLSMNGKYFEGKLGDAGNFTGGLRDVICRTADEAEKYCDCFEFTRALETIWQMVATANKYVNDQKPWEMAKQERFEELAGVINSTLEAARAAAIMIAPFMPATAKEIARQIGLADEFGSLKWANAKDESPLAAGTQTYGPEPIFPRLDTKKKEEKPAADKKQKQAQKETEKGAKDMIDYDYFSKLKIRVAEVVEAEKVEGADKLLKLQVSLGEEKRQIVAGVAMYYSPEEMVGKKIVMLTNLEPATIRGVESNGMLLAADIDGQAVILQPEKDVPAGSKIK